ncbi:MAG: hypothetical protein ACRYFS_16155 [Janthinobacterium lividum]
MNVTQADLDTWRAFTEQNRTDLLTLRQLIASRQTDAADQLIASALHQTLIAGRMLDDAGANRPAHLPARPAPGVYRDEDEE